MKAFIIITIAGLVCSVSCCAQSIPGDLSRIAEELTAFPDTDGDYETVYENLAQLLSNPIDLNVATREELESFHVLSESQIGELLRYRDDVGYLSSIYELQVVPTLDLTTIKAILPYVTIREGAGRGVLRQVTQNADHYLLIRYEKMLETKRGFHVAEPMQRFQGSDDKIYMRFRSSHAGRYSAGFTAEKDAGEPLVWQPSSRQFGADFLSGHLQIRNKGRIQNLIVGDYQVQFGQGLVLGSPFGLGKGSESITTARRANVGFMPYTSVNESGFFRGAAATISLTRNVFLSSYWSSVRRDATAEGDTILSFTATGFHRNATEMAKRRLAREDNVGAVLEFRKGSLNTAVLFSASDFSGIVERRETLYNQFAFTGERNYNASAFIHFNLNNFTFFNEVAMSLGAGRGMVAGALGSLSSRFDIAVLWRRYESDFYALYSNAFSENTQASNERGFYWGWKYQLSRAVTLQGYADLFTFPWLAFRRYAPSRGYEWLAKMSWHPSRSSQVFVLMREESKARNTGAETSLYQVVQGIKRNYNVTIAHAADERWGMKTRILYSTYEHGDANSDGLALAQDVTFSAGRFGATARYALFDTEDYDNRHYVYENDVWMSFSLPAYYGRGTRMYLVLQYKLSRRLSLWARYALSRYADRDETGSGLDAVQGNARNDFRFQALFRF